MSEYARIVKSLGLGTRGHLSTLTLGLLLTLALAGVSFATWWLLKDTFLKFSALLWSFIYSMVVTNILPGLSEERFKEGIEFASSRLLRLAIALLGLTVSASVWSKLGGVGFASVLINLATVFAFGILFCRYVLKLDSTLGILIAAGTSICGASAIAALGPALKAKAEEIGLAVASVTLFGLIAMFIYPLLFNGPLVGWFGSSATAFGMWAGMGIHETAQVIAAGSQVSGALSVAVSAKMIRIFMIGPIVFISLFVYSRNKTEGRIKLAIPWFAIAFLVFTVVNLGLELLPIGDLWKAFNSTYISPAVTFLLAWSFAGIGLKVRYSTIRSIGLKAFLGGMVVAVVAGGTALLLVKYLWLDMA